MCKYVIQCLHTLEPLENLKGGIMAELELYEAIKEVLGEADITSYQYQEILKAVAKILNI